MSALGLLEIKPLPMSTRAVFSVLFEIVPDFNDLNSAKIVGSIPGPKTSA